MSKIEEMIREMCPEGVRWVKLGEVTSVLRGKRLTKSQLSDDEKYPVYHGGIQPIGYYSEYNRTANTVMVINVGASAGTVGFCDKDFWSSDGCFCVAHAECVNSKFLYYLLSNHQRDFQSKVRTAGIPTLDASVLTNYEIPLPPLPIQEKIVEILEKFSLLSAELEAELEGRRKQYDFYRNRLLSFDSGSDSVMWKTLGEVACYAKSRISLDEVDEDNYVGVENLLQNKLGKTISTSVPTSGNCIEYIEGDILIGNIRPYLKKIWLADRRGGTNGDVLTIRILPEFSERILPRYLFHLLSSEEFFNYDNQYAKGAKMPRGDKNAVLKYPIPVPPLAEQERIVRILDKFEALVTDLSVGLPAEIERVQKQYEYYRNKLLTFPEA